MELNKGIIGMLHLQALAGTPRNSLKFAEILDFTLRETEIYLKYNINTLMIENMQDVPYLKRQVGPEIVASMAIIAYEIKKRFDLNLGIQILAGANREAIACAMTSGADFIRAEGFVFAHVADEGLMDGCAGDLLRYRKQIGAEGVKIYCDIKKKHSAHTITADVSIAETAKAAQFFEADGVIVTGSSTGDPANVAEVKAVKESVNIPVLVGSGVTAENVQNYIKIADALIIGSYLKKDGNWKNDLSEERIALFLSKYNQHG